MEQRRRKNRFDSFPGCFSELLVRLVHRRGYFLSFLYIFFRKNEVEGKKNIRTNVYTVVILFGSEGVISGWTTMGNVYTVFLIPVGSLTFSIVERLSRSLEGCFRFI